MTLLSTLNMTLRWLGRWHHRLHHPKVIMEPISKLVSESWTWKDRMELGQFYLNRMANMYSHKNWGTNNVAVFSRALSGIGTVFTSRNTNLYGVLDNDDFFDYWGGLSMALEYVNGKAPNMYVLDYSNRANQIPSVWSSI